MSRSHRGGSAGDQLPPRCLKALAQDVELVARLRPAADQAFHLSHALHLLFDLFLTLGSVVEVGTDNAIADDHQQQYPQRHASQGTFAYRQALPKLGYSHGSTCAPRVKVSP